MSFPRRVIPISAVALALCLLAAGLIARRAHSPVGRTFRMGFEQSPPDQFVANGKPYGPTYDIVDLAARNAGIHLDWVYAPEGPEKAMSSGHVDMWPLFGDLPGRRGRFYYSNPYSSQQFWLLVDAASSIHSAAEAAGKTMAVRYPGTNERAARMFLPASTQYLHVPTFDKGLGAICARQTEGLFLWERGGRSLLLDPPHGCEGHNFRYIGLSGAHVYFGVAASILNPDARYAVDAIREQLSELSREGFINATYLTWIHQSTNDTQIIDLIDASRRRSLLLALACGMLALVAVFVLWQNKRLKAMRGAAEEAATSAQRAAAVKSDFLANMSHELRTPMNGIIASCELLLETPMRPDQEEFGGTILNSARALLGLLNDVLDLAKIEAGRMTVHREPFDLLALLESVRLLAEPSARRKQIAFTLAVDPSVERHYKGDSVRIRQVLLNLVSNAVKFTEAGGVAVSVSPTFGPAVRFSIADTGIGIPAATQIALFQKFTQADASTTRKFGGTGLGLAISKQLVELMGGSIGVASREGEGSRFYFDLPLESVALSPVAAAQPAPPVRRFDGTRILIAEDNVVNQKVLSEMLRRRGCIVEIAVNGAEAVDKATASQYALILMDCQMPVMDGFEATRRLRELLGAAAPPIVAVTARAMEQDRRQCMESGMCDHLVKPIGAASVIAMLEKWLGAAHVDAA